MNARMCTGRHLPVNFLSVAPRRPPHLDIMRALLLAAFFTSLFSSCQTAPSTAGEAIEAPAESWAPFVEDNLRAAGGNRGELETALRHFRDGGDAQKLEAIQFLIANMEGQGYSEIVLVATDGTQLDYNSLDYANYDEAQKVLDDLEVAHGGVDFKAVRFEKDLEVITADLLIENVDLAFDAYRNNPWSQNLSFGAFLEHVLPYRGSNEPLESWRPLVLARSASIQAELADESDARTAAVQINREATRWLGFDTIFYMHPTDMGYGEMVQRGKGRCEDITNMQTYASRANSLASAADYTPYWADRDNNHAWNVNLDANGEGNAGLSARAAKVYRKMFSLQRDCLAFDLAEGEEAPHWLDRKHYIDVTSQYKDVAEVNLNFTVPAPANSTHAYLAVFNSGVWNAIAWAPLKEGAASFQDMGLDIGYLPAYFSGGKLVPAAAPFFLDTSGEMHPYAGSSGLVVAQLSATARNTMEFQEDGSLRSRLVVGENYELFEWRNGDWNSLAKIKATETPIRAELAADGLYWLVQDGSRRLERPFMLRDGTQIWM
jgi:hypothetical protein